MSHQTPLFWNRSIWWQSDPTCEALSSEKALNRPWTWWEVMAGRRRTVSGGWQRITLWFLMGIYRVATRWFFRNSCSIFCVLRSRLLQILHSRVSQPWIPSKSTVCFAVFKIGHVFRSTTFRMRIFNSPQYVVGTIFTFPNKQSPLWNTPQMEVSWNGGYPQIIHLYPFISIYIHF